MVELNPSMTGGQSPEAAALIDSLALPRLVVTVLGLIAIYLLGLKKGMLYSRPILVWGLSGTYALGVLLTYFCSYGTEPFLPGLAAGSLLTATSIMLIPLWFEVLCCESTIRVALYAAGAYALSNAMTLVVTDLSYLAFVLTTAAMPLVSGALLHMLRNEPEAPNTTSLLHAAPTFASTLRQTPFKVFLGTAVFGVSILMANSISEQRHSFSTEIYTVVAGLVVALAVTTVVLIALGLHRRLDFTLLYRLMVPLLVTCLLLVMIAESGFQTYEALALGGTWTFYRIVTAALWCSAAADTMLPPASTIAIAQITQSVLNKAEGPVLSLVASFNQADAVTIAIIVVLVVFASVFLLNENELRFKSETWSTNQSSKQDPYEPHIACIQTAAEKYALSQREQELCTMLLYGMTSSEIRDTLAIAPGTFKTHMRNIYGKLDVHSRSELIDLLQSL